MGGGGGVPLCDPDLEHTAGEWDEKKRESVKFLFGRYCSQSEWAQSNHTIAMMFVLNACDVCTVLLISYHSYCTAVLQSPPVKRSPLLLYTFNAEAICHISKYIICTAYSILAITGGTRNGTETVSLSVAY